MNKETFISRLITAQSPADIVRLFKDSIEELEIKDSEGEEITPDSVLIEVDFTPKEGNTPPFRIKVTPLLVSLYHRGLTFEIPTEHFCGFMQGMNTLHDDWHGTLISVLNQAGQSFLTDTEKILSQTLPHSSRN